MGLRVWGQGLTIRKTISIGVWPNHSPPDWEHGLKSASFLFDFKEYKGRPFQTISEGLPVLAIKESTIKINVYTDKFHGVETMAMFDLRFGK